MKHKREFVVGITLLVAIVMFVFGIRYFQDLPFFGGAYTLETSFEDSGGLVAGSPVRVNGVNAGTVRSVNLRTDLDDVHVRFDMHGNVLVPVGSWVRVSGMELLGNVHLEVVLASAEMMIEPGSVVPSRQQENMFEVMERAPDIAARTDTLLATSQRTLEDLRHVIHEQSALLEQTMLSMRSAAQGFHGIMASNEEAISNLINNTSRLSDNLSRFAETNTDSLSVSVYRVNETLRLLNARLVDFGETTSGIDSLVVGVQRGHGTLGLLANDPGLYQRIDSTLTSLNRLLIELERNPERFMRELRLIDIF